MLSNVSGRSKAISFVMGLAALVAAPAQAVVVGYAEITNVQVVLVDLDPNDGITPSLSFGEAAFHGPASVYTRVGAPLYQGDIVYGPMNTALQHSTTGPSMHAISTLTPTALGVTATAYARADGETFAHAHTNALQSFQFELSPMTMLVLTADSAAATISSTLAGEQTNVGARLLIQVGNQQTWAGAFPGWGDGTASNLQISYSNDTHAAVGGLVDAMAYAWVQGVANPVPEPGSAGLASAAIGLLVATTRRRRPQALAPRA